MSSYYLLQNVLIFVIILLIITFENIDHFIMNDESFEQVNRWMLIKEKHFHFGFH